MLKLCKTCLEHNVTLRDKMYGRLISQAFKRGRLLGKGPRLLKETKTKLAFFSVARDLKKRRCKKSPAESGIALIDRGPTHE